MRRIVVALALLVVVPASLGPGAPEASANPIQAENARRGDGGWEVPAQSGTLISGYASEVSVSPGQSFQLHVRAPEGTRYRVLVYRLGWYRGMGARLVTCVPGCASSRRAVSQPQPTAPDPRSGLFETPWRVTDRVAIAPEAVSGYYEAKLEIVSGPGAGALGVIPLIVREPSPRAAVLIEVPVNTWQAYDTWGGKSFYGIRGSTHAPKVSFQRPYDGRILHDMGFDLELPWVRFLERGGVDVAYQTDADTDRDPGSLLRHRLVFSIGHDEYWTQRMRDGFDHALGLGTNLMFGSNSGLWRARYEDHWRTLVDWRNPYADPVHDFRYDTGEFRRFGEPECGLMAVQYQPYAQRSLSAPPTPYTVVGPAGDPWLSAAGLRAGDVIGGVVGYEWDSLVPGCFNGQVVPLMHAVPPGSDGVPRSADMVRATAPSGGLVFAMGTMELGWALDGFGGGRPNPRVRAFVKAALRGLMRPAAPARLIIRRTRNGLAITVRLRSSDPRILRVSIRPLGGGSGCRDALHASCRLSARRRAVRYSAVAIDPWGASLPLISGPIR
jgi:hypothetical protein